MNYIVKYCSGAYSGEHAVEADDKLEAIAKGHAWVRREMMPVMYADSYRVREAGDLVGDEVSAHE